MNCLCHELKLVRVTCYSGTTFQFGNYNTSEINCVQRKDPNLMRGEGLRVSKHRTAQDSL